MAPVQTAPVGWTMWMRQSPADTGWSATLGVCAAAIEGHVHARTTAPTTLNAHAILISTDRSNVDHRVDAVAAFTRIQ